MTFDKLWNEINYDNASRIKKHFPEFAGKLLYGLLVELVKQEDIDIGISYENRRASSMVTYNRWESEKELSLFLNKSGEYHLFFGFWDEDGEFQKTKYRLNSEEIANIPDGLKDLMIDTLKNLKSITVSKRTFNK